MDLSVWLAATSVLVGLLYSYSTWTFSTLKKQGIRGPKPWPLVGNIPDLLGKSFLELDVVCAREFGKVCSLYVGRRPVLLVSDPDVVKEITIKEFSSFANRTPVLSNQGKPIDRTLVELRDDHWRHVRNTVLPAFSSGKLRQMLPLIDDCCRELITYIHTQKGEPVKVKSVMSAFTLDAVASVTFGLDVRSLENPEHPFVKSARSFLATGAESLKSRVALGVSLASKTLYKHLSKLGLSVVDLKAASYMERAVLRTLADSSSSMNEKNLVQLFLKNLVYLKDLGSESIHRANDLVWTSKGLLLDDVISNAITVLIAGHETTSALLTFFCYAMAKNPDIQEKVFWEICSVMADGVISDEKLKAMQYLECCINETLRMYPPFGRFDRQCTLTAQLGGLTVQEGMTLLVSIYAIHHDPEYWPEPEVFKPERFLSTENHKAKAFLPFGSGPRNCIGLRLALLKAKTAIVHILREYSINACSDTAEHPLKWKPHPGLLVPSKPIIVSFQPRLHTVQ